MPNSSSSSQSGDNDSQDLALECPTTPSSSPPKPYNVTPKKSPSKSSRHEKELKRLILIVQDLAQNLKKRDGQVQELHEQASEMAMTLAASRSELDELRDQLAAATELLPASPVSVAAPALSLPRILVRWGMAPKAAPN
jgi:peptidoglycan hydrolase CwlO-like protein